MIKKIWITNPVNETLELELTRPELSGLLIRNIEGLGPPTADINMTELAANDGGIFNTSRVGSREIVMSFQFITDELVEDIRLMTYRYFPQKKNVTFEIETDRRKCKTVGYVESNEPDIFSKTEGCQVTLLCPNAHFESMDSQIVSFKSVDPEFQFPFSNNSLQVKLLKMGTINPSYSKELFYDGDAETGLTIHIRMTGEVRQLSIYNATDGAAAMSIDDGILEYLTGSKFVTGDELTIVTKKGERSVTLVRQGISYNILNAFKRPIEWMTITHGNNYFAYAAVEGIQNMDFSIEYSVLYVGV